MDGLQHLGDAIHSRNEVSQYHKHVNTADSGHGFFNSCLEGFQATLVRLIPAKFKCDDVDSSAPQLARNDPEDNLSPSVFIQVSPTHADHQDEEDEDDQLQDPEIIKPQDNTSRKATILLIAEPENFPLTLEEEVLQRDFLILHFLYVFNRIQAIVSEMWQLYHGKVVNATTAAIVTDLAQSHIQLCVATLAEELNIPPGSLWPTVEELFKKVATRSNLKGRATTQPSGQALRRLFCIDAIEHLETHYASISITGKVAEASPTEGSLELFLRFFDVIRARKLKLPIWDKFTEAMLMHRNSSKDWMPFGIQMLVDTHLHEDSGHIINDLTEHGLDIGKLIRLHTDYEYVGGGNQARLQQRGASQAQ